ncbi:Uncharacterised protein [Chlamydia abortus]|nr:Uncharacterised protein [Chlamydia abortus]
MLVSPLACDATAVGGVLVSGLGEPCSLATSDDAVKDKGVWGSELSKVSFSFSVSLAS